MPLPWVDPHPLPSLGRCASASQLNAIDDADHSRGGPASCRDRLDCLPPPTNETTDARRPANITNTFDGSLRFARDDPTDNNCLAINTEFRDFLDINKGDRP